MIPWFLRGLRRGVVTSKYPSQADVYGDGFPASIALHPSPEIDVNFAAMCPTGAIQVGRDGPSIDRGRCILCMRCVDSRPDLATVIKGSQTARAARTALVVPTPPDSHEEVERLRAGLRRRTQALGRSLHIRHVDLGSDGSDEWEVMALLNPYYDIQRLGIFFTASPKHADALLLTGVGARSMAEPLRKTIEVLPRPYVIIAAGTDAISGGLVAPTYASTSGVAALLPPGETVDVWVPGSPASPFALLHGLLLALGRVPDPGSGR